MERLYEIFREIFVLTHDLLGEWSSVDPAYRPERFAPIEQIRELVEQGQEILGSATKLELRQYSCSEIDWMDGDFVQKLNGSNIQDRFCLLGEAISCWNALHAHLGKRAPICPLLLEDGLEDQVDPYDF